MRPRDATYENHAIPLGTRGLGTRLVLGSAVSRIPNPAAFARSASASLAVARRRWESRTHIQSRISSCARPVTLGRQRNERANCCRGSSLPPDDLSHVAGRRLQLDYCHTATHRLGYLHRLGMIDERLDDDLDDRAEWATRRSTSWLVITEREPPPASTCRATGASPAACGPSSMAARPSSSSAEPVPC